MKIRSILTEDVPAIWDINQANVPMVGAVDEVMMDVLIENCQHALLIEAGETAGSAEQSIAGFCLVFGPGSPYESVNYRWFAKHAPSAHYLDRVALLPWAQRRGLGTALYDHVFATLVKQGATELGLEVNTKPANLPSLRFHDRHGFREVGSQRTPYGTTVSLRLKDLT